MKQIGIMDKADIRSLTVFIRVAQARSFTGASLALGISVTAVSHTVRQLEQELQARLFNRSTRSVSLTEAGDRLLQRVAPLLDDLQVALGEVSSVARGSMGSLKLNLPPSAAELVIKPIMREFLLAYPEIRLELAVDNSLVDIVDKGYDAGIRYDNVLADGMVTVPLITDIRFAVVASPAYVAANGKPKHPDALLEHACINYQSAHTGGVYRWEFERGREKFRVAVKGRVASNDNDLLLQAAIDGFGYAYLRERTVLPYVQSGQLVQVLDGWVPSTGLYLYYFDRSGMPQKLRAFIDFLRQHLQREG
jgi:DNA-binding transcriptional LysR family regulator